MRWSAKVDDNQPEIVAALRKMGAVVTPIHRLGQGIPDILISYRGRWLVGEIKDGSKSPSAQRLTPDEEAWIARQAAPVLILTSPEQAVSALDFSEYGE